jgi:hypothetical protein
VSAGSSSTSRLEALLEAGERDELLRVLMPGQRHAAMDTGRTCSWARS